MRTSDAEQRADLYERLGATDDDAWWLDCARGSPDGRVIEFGAGTGRLTRALRTTGVGVVAIERDAAMLDRLYLAQAHDPSIEVVAGDVTALAADHRAGRVLLPAGLMNELPDAASRQAALHVAAACCLPGGLVAMQLLSPWWLAGLAGRTQGRLAPLPPADVGAGTVEVVVEAGDLDPWCGRRHATLTYRFPDGVVHTDALDAAIVTGSELVLLLREAGLVVHALHGARPPAPMSGDDVAWHVVAAPAPAG